ncbi:MAG: hypothetical protein M1815_000830 [Lichina confinis]|nr:MAG: hypothetical protein M1815_000830 [Lichina confinis]
MKQMQRDPLASSKARKAERKADEKSGLITIKPLKLESSSSTATAGGGGGFKKAGFKSAFASVAAGSGGEVSKISTDTQAPRAAEHKPAIAGFKKVATTATGSGTGGGGGGGGAGISGDASTDSKDGGQSQHQQHPQNEALPQQQQQQLQPPPRQEQAVGAEDPQESDTEDEGYEMYDPRYPTD